MTFLQTGGEEGAEERRLSIYEAVGRHLAARTGIPTFAERVLRNIQSGLPGSLRLDAGGLDHFRPLLGVIDDEFPEIVRRAGKHRATKFGKPRL